jgi:hypothetical protein
LGAAVGLPQVGSGKALEAFVRGPGLCAGLSETFPEPYKGCPLAGQLGLSGTRKRLFVGLLAPKLIKSKGLAAVE